MNDGGVVYVPQKPPGWPVGPTGLYPGAVYLVPDKPVSAAFGIGVVPGLGPDPKSYPLFLATTNPATLLRFGAGNLPLSSTGAGLLTDQLFVNGGLLCVA
jgi:hypothetical protein